MMVMAMAVTLGALALLIFAMVRGIRQDSDENMEASLRRCGAP